MDIAVLGTGCPKCDKLTAETKLAGQELGLDAEVRKEVSNGGNREAAKVVGAKLGQRAVESGIDTVAFDRSGFKYHGRIAAFADAAREAGLKF